MSRRELIESMFDSHGFGLEIGPSHAPIFPKRLGYNVEILDYADADGLRSKYAAIDIDTSAIEDVDYVSDGRPMDEVIGKEGRYDFIFSSHVIEHVTDILSLFKSSEFLLKKHGTLVFAIPDKRYIFDAFQMPSTTGDVLQAFIERRNRHAPARIFDFFASSSYLNDGPTWSIDRLGYPTLMGTPQNAKVELDKALNSPETYTDVHGWYFTPSSLRLIMHDLYELKLIELREVKMMEHGNFEFYVTYSRTGLGCGLDRAALVRSVVREQTLSGLQMLAGSNDISQALRSGLR